MVGDSNDKTNFPHKLLLLLLTNTQVSMLCKDFVNGSSANIKFLKTQLSRLVQLGERVLRDIPYLGNFLTDAAKH